MNQLTTELFPKIQPRKIYSVSQVNRIAKETLENFSGWVHGEIAELEKIKTRFGSFFFKFKLKDEVTNYTLPVIAWSEVENSLDFELKDGIGVVVFGNLTLYEKSGSYQFQAQIIELFGEGQLAKKFEELKRKLRAEGLFDESRKKPIPKYPLKIGVITSETGAAWIDFKKHTIDKFPFFQVLLADVFVQGQQAIPDLIWAIEKLNRKDLDLIVLTRGGGSLEDLAAFNSEELARAIAKSQIPVISAVGHERDETISDWVADSRASTPTAAAKLITANFEEFLAKESYYLQTLKSLTTKFYQTKLLEISLLEKDLVDNLKSFVNNKKIFLTDSENQLRNLPPSIVTNWETTLKNFFLQLQLLSPQRILNRGYSITFKLPEMIVLKEAKKVETGDEIKVRLAKGEILGKVS